MTETRAFADVPVNRLLGFQLVASGGGRAELRLPVRPEFAQETGVVHGGIVTALADTCAVYAVWPDLPEGRTLIGIEFKLNFLAAARPDGAPLRAVATLLRGGRTIAVCESEVFQGDALVAKGTFTFLQRDRR